MSYISCDLQFKLHPDFIALVTGPKLKVVVCNYPAAELCILLNVAGIPCRLDEKRNLIIPTTLPPERVKGMIETAINVCDKVFLDPGEREAYMAHEKSKAVIVSPPLSSSPPFPSLNPSLNPSQIFSSKALKSAAPATTRPAAPTTVPNKTKPLDARAGAGTQTAKVAKGKAAASNSSVKASKATGGGSEAAKSKSIDTPIATADLQDSPDSTPLGSSVPSGAGTFDAMAVLTTAGVPAEGSLAIQALGHSPLPMEPAQITWTGSKGGVEPSSHKPIVSVIEVLAGEEGVDQVIPWLEVMWSAAAICDGHVPTPLGLLGPANRWDFSSVDGSEGLAAPLHYSALIQPCWANARSGAVDQVSCEFRLTFIKHPPDDTDAASVLLPCMASVRTHQSGGIVSSCKRPSTLLLKRTATDSTLPSDVAELRREAMLRASGSADMFFGTLHQLIQRRLCHLGIRPPKVTKLTNVGVSIQAPGWRTLTLTHMPFEVEAFESEMDNVVMQLPTALLLGRFAFLRLANRVSCEKMKCYVDRILKRSQVRETATLDEDAIASAFRGAAGFLRGNQQSSAVESNDLPGTIQRWAALDEICEHTPELSIASGQTSQAEAATLPASATATAEASLSASNKGTLFVKASSLVRSEEHSEVIPVAGVRTQLPSVNLYPGWSAGVVARLSRELSLVQGDQVHYSMFWNLQQSNAAHLQRTTGEAKLTMGPKFVGAQKEDVRMETLTLRQLRASAQALGLDNVSNIDVSLLAGKGSAQVAPPEAGRDDCNPVADGRGEEESEATVKTAAPRAGIQPVGVNAKSAPVGGKKRGVSDRPGSKEAVAGGSKKGEIKRVRFSGPEDKMAADNTANQAKLEPGSLEKLSINALKELLRAKGKKVGGAKAELIARLQEE